MPVCNTINSRVHRRRKSDVSNGETNSSVANLVEATASCEAFCNQPVCDPLQIAKHSKKSKTCGAFKGFIYTFLCSLFITSSSVIVKKLTYISPGQLSLIRNVGVLLGNIPIVVYSGQNPLGPRSHRLLLLIRSFLGATALYLNLLAYRLLPLAEAAIIMSSVPAVVLVAARIFLKESCGVIQTIALFITVIGVLLSIRLPEIASKRNLTSALNIEYVTGIAFAIGCVIFMAITFVTIRKMKDVHFSIVMVYLGFLGAIENAGLNAAHSYYAWPRCGLDVACVLMIAVFGFVGNSCLTLAIQAEAVGIVSVLKSSMDIFLAMILQIIFFGETPDAYSIYGAVLVLISVTIIGIRKWLQEKPEDSLARKALRVFLL